jgi:lysophospholipase L1-like esterase
VKAVKKLSSGVLFLLFFLGHLQAQVPQNAAPAPPYENEMFAFEQADAKNFPPTGAVLFVGSSSIRLWTTLADDFPQIPTINRGFGGALISEVLHYADRIIIPYKPRLIVLYIGGNDIASGKSPEEVLDTFKLLAARIHEKLPAAHLAYVSINPSIARWPLDEKNRRASELIREYLGNTSWMFYIDSYSKMLGPDGKPRAELLSEDQLHLNAAGYQLWAKIIAPYLQK